MLSPENLGAHLGSPHLLLIDGPGPGSAWTSGGCQSESTFFSFSSAKQGGQLHCQRFNMLVEIHCQVSLGYPELFLSA